MILRTAYFVGIMACALAAVSASSTVEPVHAQTLKITGPNGEVNSIVARQYGPTTSADTFWSIAQKVRPNQSITIYQVMAALFDANPHAFSSDNYNSLERGMTLLVPSADVMAQIPKADAKLRAEDNDKRFANANITVKAPQKPAVSAGQTSATSAQKPLAIVAEKTLKNTVEVNQPLIDELTVKLENAQSKSLSLTDELARSEDMLMIKDADNAALKAKIKELSLQLSVSQEELQLLSEKHTELEAAYALLVAENAKPTVIEQPTNFWRSIADNMILLAVIAALPLIIIFLIIFWLMRRKNEQDESINETPQAETSSEPLASMAGPQAAVAESLAVTDDIDDLNDLAIHLDEEDSTEDLLDLDITNETQLSLDGADDVDMYIEDEKASEQIAEGTSLDDLWSEAMNEQEVELASIEDEGDYFESLLDGLDESAEVKQTDEEDLDSLLADFDLPAEDTTEVAPELSQTDTQDDIDSLLADFDLPTDNAGEVAAEAEAEAEVAPEPSQTDVQDDIDSLLADFDLPTDNAGEVAAEAEAEAESESEYEYEVAPELSQTDTQDDIDSLLADFDLPTDNAGEVAAEAEFEVAPEPSQTDTQDDIDSLLADFDLPADEAIPEAGSEADGELDSGSLQQTPETDTQDDIDSLLADFDLAPESSNVVDTQADESANSAVDDSVDDIDALLATIDVTDDVEGAEDFSAEIAAELESDVATTLDDSENLDELLATVDPEKEFTPLATSDVDVEQQLASELAQIESELEIDSDNSDLDTLISDLETQTELPQQTAEPEESFTGADDFAAQIAAELEQEQGEHEHATTSDADLDALLADMNNEPEASLADTDTRQAEPLTFASGDDVTLGLDDDQHDDPLVNQLLAAEKSTESNNDSNTDADDLDALLADFDVDKLAEDDEPPLFSIDEFSEDERGSEAEFDNMLAGLSALDDDLAETDAAPDTVADKDTDTDHDSKLNENPEFEPKESGFFDDLKSKKAEPAKLDWESELFKQACNQDDVDSADEVNSADDGSYSLTEDNLTVDEALAALDAEEKQSTPSEETLNTFEQENGFIDIDVLLNDADEIVEVSDQYKDVEVDMGEVNALIGNAEMIDVDDEENSVNAKLDLARAYIEIEDEDAAKALLTEVKIDGNERQQSEASKLLNDIS
ncbi:FimV/HubP family polar landmark protein [Shewanella sp. 4_MG-2023]|uniref:FimV/HubP family polar landmark protein n=1 Tax=Shewanella sp. 4_MG-2023 TaxID=3062652 RepID=UPI0026E194A5|nr:FimV/HubP family polar landmark protein [Shewanella sp. 4_MG-2023]MDO6677628.1 FimV/HubP family polar landmark protein [Shewanella sp. 4_MG-2023]